MNNATDMAHQEDALTGSEPGTDTLIVGLGKTGLSCARFLSRQGVPVIVTDSRAHPPGLDELKRDLPDATCLLGGFDSRAFEQARQLIVSPGVSVREPLVAEAISRGAQVIGDVELFARYVDGPVVAVTGSNGKSTVTTLVAEMAEQQRVNVKVGGNLGTPVLDLLDSSSDQKTGESETPLYVLELSSFQLETTLSLNAEAAAVLNVSADHMDRYPGLNEYADAKRRIFHGDGVVVINREDPIVRAMAAPGRKQVSFGLDAPADRDFGLCEVDGDMWLTKGREPLLPAQEVRMPGRHNLANALAAMALAEAVGIDRSAMLKVLRRFPGLPHRMQWVAEHNGVTWYNDSKATNVGAALAAINGLSGKIVLIAGGEGKDADFSPLRDAVANKARAVVLIGRDAPLIETALQGVTQVINAADMDGAVARAEECALPGDSVLLAPACASFDMFSGYEQRGEVFTQAVKRRTG